MKNLTNTYPFIRLESPTLLAAYGTAACAANQQLGAVCDFGKGARAQAAAVRELQAMFPTAR